MSLAFSTSQLNAPGVPVTEHGTVILQPPVSRVI